MSTEVDMYNKIKTFLDIKGLDEYSFIKYIEKASLVWLKENNVELKDVEEVTFKDYILSTKKEQVGKILSNFYDKTELFIQECKTVYCYQLPNYIVGGRGLIERDGTFFVPALSKSSKDHRAISFCYKELTKEELIDLIKEGHTWDEKDHFEENSNIYKYLTQFEKILADLEDIINDVSLFIYSFNESLVIASRMKSEKYQNFFSRIWGEDEYYYLDP